jgi:hypothetical protein
MESAPPIDRARAEKEMKRKLIIAAVLLFVAATVALAAEPKLQELKEKVQTASLKNQAKLYVQIAEMELKSVDENYSSGDAERGQGVLEEMTSACEKAVAAATSSRKYMKKTEIALRGIETKLTAIGEGQSFETRAPIKEANDRIEHARNSLVDAMFAK